MNSSDDFATSSGGIHDGSGCESNNGDNDDQHSSNNNEVGESSVSVTTNGASEAEETNQGNDAATRTRLGSGTERYGGIANTSNSTRQGDDTTTVSSMEYREALRVATENSVLDVSGSSGTSSLTASQQHLAELQQATRNSLQDVMGAYGDRFSTASYSQHHEEELRRATQNSLEDSSATNDNDNETTDSSLQHRDEMRRATENSIRDAVGAYSIVPGGTATRRERNSSDEESRHLGSIDEESAFQPTHNPRNPLEVIPLQYLPPNIDIIAEASLVTEEDQNQIESDEDDVDTIGLRWDEQPSPGGADPIDSVSVSASTITATYAPTLANVLEEQSVNSWTDFSQGESLDTLGLHVRDGPRRGGAHPGETTSVAVSAITSPLALGAGYEDESVDTFGLASYDRPRQGGAGREATSVAVSAITPPLGMSRTDESVDTLGLGMYDAPRQGGAHPRETTSAAVSAITTPSCVDDNESVDTLGLALYDTPRLGGADRDATSVAVSAITPPLGMSRTDESVDTLGLGMYDSPRQGGANREAASVAVSAISTPADTVADESIGTLGLAAVSAMASIVEEDKSADTFGLDANYRPNQGGASANKAFSHALSSITTPAGMSKGDIFTMGESRQNRIPLEFHGLHLVDSDGAGTLAGERIQNSSGATQHEDTSEDNFVGATIAQRSSGGSSIRTPIGEVMAIAHRSLGGSSSRTPMGEVMAADVSRTTPTTGTITDSATGEGDLEQNGQSDNTGHDRNTSNNEPIVVHAVRVKDGPMAFLETKG